MKKTKVADLTIEEFKDIIRQVIKEEIPVLTTINTYSQKSYLDQHEIWYSTDTQSRPYKKLEHMYKCEADSPVGIAEASDLIKKLK